MKTRIKNYLIHKLGGKTVSECADKSQKARNAGYNFAYVEVHEYMKELNGLNAQDWSERVWKYVTERRTATSQAHE